LDESKLTDCPASDIYIAGRKCGKIMVFVNLSEYTGATVGDVMDEYNMNHGLTTNTSSTTQEQILTFLENYRNERTNGATYKSEIFTDRVSAVTEVISPSIFTRMLKSDNIEGLSLMVTNIGTTTASTTINILSDVNFFGTPYFTKDTGGTAVIKKGSKTVEVVFDREYIQAPIVNATIAFNASTSDASIEEAVFSNDIRYIITNRSTKGFTIKLNKPTTEDLSFNYIALAIKNAGLFTSRDEAVIAPTDTQLVSTTTPPIINTNNTATVIIPIIENTSTSTATTTTSEVVVTPPPAPVSTTTPITTQTPITESTSTPPVIEPIPVVLPPEPTSTNSTSTTP